MENEKRDQVLSMKVTKRVISKIKYLKNRQNISIPDLITSYVLGQNDDSEILTSISWESNLIQEKVQEVNNHLLNKINEIGTDYWLLQKASQISIDSENTKNINLYKKGDIILTNTNILVVITSINTEKKEFTVTSLPITDTAHYKVINLVDSHQNIISLLRYLKEDNHE